MLTVYYCLTTLLAWQIGHPAGVLARVFFLACVGLNALNVQWQHHRCGYFVWVVLQIGQRSVAILACKHGYSPRFAWGGRPHRRFISVRNERQSISMFLQRFPSKHGTLHFCRHKTGRNICSTMLPIGASQAKQFALFPRVEASQARIFTFPPWRLPKLGNFRFSPLGGFPSEGTLPFVGASQAKNFHFPPRGGSPS